MLWIFLLLPALMLSDSLPEPQYALYTADGSPTTLDVLLQATDTVEVIFFGETHNDPNAHALEALLLRKLTERHRPLALSMEMFERDVQLVMDEYLQGFIRERDFLRDSRPWKNYRTDYRPLVEWAKTHTLPVLAANAPARYVHLAARQGIQALSRLSEQARAFLPPLPLHEASSRYRSKFFAEMRRMMPRDTTAHADTLASPPPMHGNFHIMDGQNLRDASMAYTIALHLIAYPSGKVFHVNGAFHSDEGLGTPEHLRRFRPGTRMLILSARPSETFPDFNTEKMAGIADFIFVTPPVED